MKSCHFRFLIILIGCFAVLSACDAGGTTITTTVASSSSSSSIASGTSPTATPTASITPCSTIVTGYGPASGGSMFSDVPFPANSSSSSVTLTHAGNSFKFAIYGEDVCTAGSSTDTVRSFFAAQLPAVGFVQSTTFPFDSLFEAPCGDPYCWASPHARYVGLESVTDHGNGLITYHLRFAFPPSAPTCAGSGWSSGYYYKVPHADLPSAMASVTVPLPPLTRIRPNTTAPTGSETAIDLCSPMFNQTDYGESSVIDFMTAHGWNPVSPGLNFIGGGGTILVALESTTAWTYVFSTLS